MKGLNEWSCIHCRRKYFSSSSQRKCHCSERPSMVHATCKEKNSIHLEPPEVKTGYCCICHNTVNLEIAFTEKLESYYSKSAKMIFCSARCMELKRYVDLKCRDPERSDFIVGGRGRFSHGFGLSFGGWAEWLEIMKKGAIDLLSTDSYFRWDSDRSNQFWCQPCRTFTNKSYMLPYHRYRLNDCYECEFGEGKTLCPNCDKIIPESTWGSCFCSANCLDSFLRIPRGFILWCFVCQKQFNSIADIQKCLIGRTVSGHLVLCCSSYCKSRIGNPVRAKKEREKRCTVCGEFFHKRAKNHKYCSERCCKLRNHLVQPIGVFDAKTFKKGVQDAVER